MKLFEKIRSVTRLQIILLTAIIWTLASILVLMINPAARKGPLGFGPLAPMTTFRVKDGSFSISYPQNWAAFETPHGSHGDYEVVAVILVSGRFGSNVTIARQSFQNGDINDVVTWGQSRAAMHANYTPLSLTPLTDNKLGGFVQEYTWFSSSLYSITSRCQDIYVFANNTGYALSFCSDEQDWPSLKNVFVQMGQSFAVQGESK